MVTCKEETNQRRKRRRRKRRRRRRRNTHTPLYNCCVAVFPPLHCLHFLFLFLFCFFLFASQVSIRYNLAIGLISSMIHCQTDEPSHHHHHHISLSCTTNQNIKEKKKKSLLVEIHILFKKKKRRENKVMAVSVGTVLHDRHTFGSTRDATIARCCSCCFAMTLPS
jgi:hypothetical protein